MAGKEKRNGDSFIFYVKKIEITNNEVILAAFRYHNKLRFIYHHFFQRQLVIIANFRMFI